ncbi:MAG: L,D-transpeptidase family protein, partial [Planctomycetota bacterium]
MARYPYTRRGNRGSRTRSRIYIVSALLIIGVVIAFMYGNRPRGRSEDETPVFPTDANVVKETVPPPPHLPAQADEGVKPAPEPNLPKSPPKPTVDSNPQVAELIDEAMALISTGPSRVIEARGRLNEALPMPMSGQQREFVKRQLSWLADKWLFSRSVFPQDRLCSTYKVKPGDQLRTIGEQFKVPYEVLMEINNIPRAEALKAGESIKVVNGPFNVKVYRSTFTMDLYLQNTFVRSFPVGLGKPGRETPTGLWCVEPGGKLVKPAWTDPDTNKTYHPESSDYPLGSRWIGLKGLEGEAKGRTGIAFHGTKKPEEIGTAGSRGCIRLHNGDVILIYNVLVPVHS